MNEKIDIICLCIFIEKERSFLNQLYSEKIKAAEKSLQKQFEKINRIAEINTQKVLEAFWEEHVSESMLHGTTGYGTDDKGRDTLDKIYARVFGSEDALVRHNFVSGTHVLSTALYGILRPGDTLYSVTGDPYDTLIETIGIRETVPNSGSLVDFGIKYIKTELSENGNPDFKEIEKILKENKSIKMVYIQRSRGYTQRPTLSLENIEKIAKLVKSVSDAVVFVDNCYGEFVCEKEPTQIGADLMGGSLIKNPGGGLAQTGGYLAGKKDLIEKCAYRLTAVGLGKECGATHSQLRNMYQGFFLAPHVVAQAKKTALFAARLFYSEGFEVSPKPDEDSGDIIQTIKFNDQDLLIAFCKGIQSGAPIDSFVTPEPCDSPGYADKVIMAAGAFVSGASIELSADAPIKPPYTAYFQGGLTYESGKIAIIKALQIMSELKDNK